MIKICLNKHSSLPIKVISVIMIIIYEELRFIRAIKLLKPVRAWKRYCFSVQFKVYSDKLKVNKNKTRNTKMEKEKFVWGKGIEVKS